MEVHSEGRASRTPEGLEVEYERKGEVQDIKFYDQSDKRAERHSPANNIS